MAGRATVRNDNPGALDYDANNRWVGDAGRDGRFQRFTDEVYGFRAQAMTLMKYTSTHNLTTLRQITSRYAPAVENDTNSYIAVMARELGISDTSQVVIPGTNFIRPEILKQLVRDKARFEVAWPKPLDAAWDPAKYQIGVAMAMARRGTQYLQEARARGDQTAERAALQILEEAKKLDPEAVRVELERGDREVPEAQLRAEVAQLTQNYTNGTIKPDVLARGADVDVATLGRRAAEDGRRRLAETAVDEAFRTPRAVLDKLNLKDPRDVARANDFYKRLRDYAKAKGVDVDKEMPERTLTVEPDAADKEAHERFTALRDAMFTSAAATAEKLAKENKADRDAPLPGTADEPAPTIGNVRDRHTRESQERDQGERRARDEQQKLNDFAQMGLGADDIFFLALLLMAFGHHDLARQLMSSMGDRGGPSGSRGPSRGPGIDRPYPDTPAYRGGNVRTLDPRTPKPDPKNFNFFTADGAPILMLPLQQEKVKVEREGKGVDLTPPASDKPATVVAPASAEVTHVGVREGHGLTIELTWKKDGKTYVARLSNLGGVREGLKVGDKVNAGDVLAEIGESDGSGRRNLDLEVEIDGQPTDRFRFAGHHGGAPLPDELAFEHSRKAYKQLEFEENNRFLNPGSRSTDILTSAPDERHTAPRGTTGLSYRGRGQNPSWERSRGLPFDPKKHIPAAVLEAAMRHPKGVAIMIGADDAGQGQWAGRLFAIQVDKTTGEVKDVKILGAGGGGKENTENITNGPTPGAWERDFHPDADITAAYTTKRATGSLRTWNVAGWELENPPGLTGRNYFYLHDITSPSDPERSSGCVTISDYQALVRWAKEKGVDGPGVEVMFVHPNVLKHGASTYKERERDVVAQEAPKGTLAQVVGTDGRIRGVVPAPGFEDRRESSMPPMAWTDPYGRIAGGNRVNELVDPMSNTKMFGALTLGIMRDAGELPKEFFERSDVRHHLDQMMRRSNNHSAKWLAEEAALAAYKTRDPKLFVERMNRAVAELGLTETRFSDAHVNVPSANYSGIASPAGFNDGRKGTRTTVGEIAVAGWHFQTRFPDLARYGDLSREHTGRRFSGLADNGKTGTGHGDFKTGGTKSFVGMQIHKDGRVTTFAGAEMTDGRDYDPAMRHAAGEARKTTTLPPPVTAIKMARLTPEQMEQLARQATERYVGADALKAAAAIEGAPKALLDKIHGWIPAGKSLLSPSDLKARAADLTAEEIKQLREYIEKRVPGYKMEGAPDAVPTPEALHDGLRALSEHEEQLKLEELERQHTRPVEEPSLEEEPPALGTERGPERAPTRTEPVPERRTEVSPPFPSPIKDRRPYTINYQTGVDIARITARTDGPSWVKLDEKGAVVAGENILAPVTPASIQKLGIVLTMYRLEKEGKLPKGFIESRKEQIATMLAESSGNMANTLATEAVRATGSGARNPIGQFGQWMNETYAHYGLNATRVRTSVSGGGDSTVHDMARLQHILRTEFPDSQALYRAENERWTKGQRQFDSVAEELLKPQTTQVVKPGALDTGPGRLSSRGVMAYSWLAGTPESTIAVAETATPAELLALVRKAREAKAPAPTRAVPEPEVRTDTRPAPARSPAGAMPVVPPVTRRAEGGDDKPLILVVDRGHGRTPLGTIDHGSIARKGEAAPDGRTTLTNLTERNIIEGVSSLLPDIVTRLEAQHGRKIQLVFSDDQHRPADRFQQRIDVTRQWTDKGYDVIHLALHADRPKDHFASPVVAMDYRATAERVADGRVFARAYHDSIGVAPSLMSQRAYHAMLSDRTVNTTLFPNLDDPARVAHLLPHNTTLVQYSRAEGGDAHSHLHRPIPASVPAILLEVDDVRRLASLTEDERRREYKKIAEGIVTATMELDRAKHRAKMRDPKISLHEPTPARGIPTAVRDQLAALDMLWMTAIRSDVERRQELAVLRDGGTIEGAAAAVVADLRTPVTVNATTPDKKEPEAPAATPAVVAENTKKQAAAGTATA